MKGLDELVLVIGIVLLVDEVVIVWGVVIIVVNVNIMIVMSFGININCFNRLFIFNNFFVGLLDEINIKNDVFKVKNNVRFVILIWCG